MDDYGNQIQYSHWSNEGFDALLQAVGVRGCYGFCNWDETHWLEVSWRQVL